MSDRIGTIVGYQTYKKFALRYKISLSEVVNGKRRKKNIGLLGSEIKEYEKKNKNTVKNGLYY